MRVCGLSDDLAVEDAERRTRQHLLSHAHRFVGKLYSYTDAEVITDIWIWESPACGLKAGLLSSNYGVLIRTEAVMFQRMRVSLLSGAIVTA
jgi:hypothetical protein